MPSTNHADQGPRRALAEMLTRPDMSRRAKGLLVEMLVRADGESLSIASLKQDGIEGREAVANAVRELVDLGYVTRGPRFETGGLIPHIAPQEVSK